MGASTFYEFHEGSNRKEVFRKVTEEARYEHGHGGYSGTIAEKHEVKYIATAKTRTEARTMAEALVERDDERVDKDQPCCCIDVEEPAGFLFFGWARS